MSYSPLRSFQDKSPVVADSAYVDPAAVVIGDVVIGEDCSIWPATVIRGDMNWIRIGDRTSIQDGSVLHITHASSYNPEGYPLQIGNEVTVGHKAILHGCTIDDQVLIGMGATIMDGAHVCSHVVVGAGSVVPPGKRLNSGYLYVGTPARPVRELTDMEMEYFRYSADNYVKLKNQYLSS
ncbi:gamma carbonic anhydrase family protein [Zooshikella marina]|uniref:Gamma carbonic anhydrase family protein n=1 Tax=Zooshikella ganghwensis TaxID=202772 RepID=A0A4P9VXG7_9GAMM|nr:gamma carbonic anhydrase family protein [Zooshikella ganghwensis]MBU2708635.1 gamma carbonic anhydrase family protein [Zooshikella ganghwensis]RDH46600.1 gamma carbonic anhydrase family protein [Zooshikella ganghwensis]